jgi:hypothetical protein
MSEMVVPFESMARIRSASDAVDGSSTGTLSADVVRDGVKAKLSEFDPGGGSPVQRRQSSCNAASDPVSRVSG